MQIKHELIRETLRAWAVETNREYVGASISAAWFSRGGGALPLLPPSAPNANHVNQQNLFRWIDGDTSKAKAKVRELLPAILDALPLRISARLLVAESAEYRALISAKEAISDAADAYVSAHREMFQCDLRRQKADVVQSPRIH